MTKSLEDYLEVIGNLEEENNNPRVKDIALCLGISKPSVHTALHELENRGMIEHEYYGAINLTELGRQKYIEIKTKHETIRAYLEKILDIPFEIADNDACAMEHILSDETFEKMKAAVENL